MCLEYLIMALYPDDVTMQKVNDWTISECLINLKYKPWYRKDRPKIEMYKLRLFKWIDDAENDLNWRRHEMREIPISGE